MKRRTFLSSLIALIAPGAVRLHAAPAGRLTAASSGWPLAEVLSFSLSDLSEPWRPRTFDAWLDLGAQPDGQPRERLLKGFLMRVGPRTHDGIRAYCRLCTHEQCWIDLRQTVPDIYSEQVTTPDNPVFVCPCHTSVFDPAREGEVLAGPAPRRLYQFGLDIRGPDVLITEVERAALKG